MKKKPRSILKMTEQTDRLKKEVEIERNTKRYTVDEIKDAVIVVTDRERTANEVIAVLETKL
tara:strand:- start:511 stop:696 length:186 start_codon:yes stop_codon:yes gene_type:complete